MERRLETTTEAAAAGDCQNAMPEFCRVADLQRLFGIRRGSAYNLIADGKIKSVCLRIRGKTQGVRLVNVQSVVDLLRGLEAEQAREMAKAV